LPGAAYSWPGFARVKPVAERARKFFRARCSTADDAPANAAKVAAHWTQQTGRRRSCPAPPSKWRARSRTDDFWASAPTALMANPLQAKQLRKFSYWLVTGDSIRGAFVKIS